MDIIISKEIYMKLEILAIMLVVWGYCASNCQLDCCRAQPDRPPMKYTFYQDTGRFVGGSGDYHIETNAYSGHDEGYLNPDKQCAPGDIGPLPASLYQLSYCKNMMHEIVPRPCSFYLDPQRPAQLCGREDFFIHGCQCCTSKDDSEPPVNGCSSGCIVINYDNRRKLRLGDTVVVEHHDPQKAMVIQ